MEIKSFNFIQDKPILPGEPGYFDFYHKYFSPALKDMVLSDTCPHTIGLFSKWGSGKSSIVDQLSKDIKGEKGIDVFIFDAWKYQEDSLRRTFLLKFEDFLKDKGYSVPKDVLSAFYKRRTDSVAKSQEVPEVLDTTKRDFFQRIRDFVKDNKAVFFYLLIPLCALAALYVSVSYLPQNKTLVGLKDFLEYVNSVAWFVVLLKPVGEAALKKVTDKIFESTKTYTEIRTQVEEEDRLNSPEQFETVFNDLVKVINKGKLVIVFDNIDRVQGDVALKILSTIKTFLDPKEKSKVIFLVPCDSDAINKQISAFYNNDKSGDFDESEYLKKLFNVVVYTPEFIDEDLYQYTADLLEQTGDVKDVINKEDVISVITRAFKSDPREVKQFINNLVSAVLVASKTEVAEHILSEENIGYFTKVAVLRQKFPEAYKRLRENWSQPENILPPEQKDPNLPPAQQDQKLRDFLTLTSTISTNNVEPFIYFKASQVENTLTNSEGIRKSLIEGNMEEFRKLLSLETQISKVVRYISHLLKNYKSQPRVLLTIFKTQLEGFWNLGIQVNQKDYFELSVEVLEIIWNNYLELPAKLIFGILTKLRDQNKKGIILDRFVAVLGNEEIKAEANKAYLHGLLDEIIVHHDLFTEEQKTKLVDAMRTWLGTRMDVLLKFDTLEKQKAFIHPDVLRKVVQEDITNKNLKENYLLLKTCKDFIESLKLHSVLIKRLPQFISLQNSETPTTTPDKESFYDAVLLLLSLFRGAVKSLTEAEQRDLFNNVNNSYQQSTPEDGLQYKIANTMRWLETLSSDQETKNQSHEQINSFLSQASKDAMEKFLAYWNKETRENILQSYIERFKKQSMKSDDIFKLVYETANDSQKLLFTLHLIANKPDHGTVFLSQFGDKIPERQKVIESLVSKAQTLPLEQRVDIFNFLKGKIAQNDNVGLKQAVIKQIFEFLKSDNQSMIQFGVTLMNEKFLSPTDERDVAKEMIDFYNNRSSPLQQQDIPLVTHLSEIHEKLQDPLKEKLVYLILNNINSATPVEIQGSLLNSVAKIKADPGVYEKDYSDLFERLNAWPDSDQKTILVKELIAALETMPDAKVREYLKKVKALLKSKEE